MGLGIQDSMAGEVGGIVDAESLGRAKQEELALEQRGAGVISERKAGEAANREMLVGG